MADEFDATVVVVPIVVVVVLLLITIWCCSKCIIIVHQAEGIVLERLGKFQRVLDAGLNFVVPFIDQPRGFSWRRTYISNTGSGSVVVDELLNSTRIDLRESVFNFLQLDVFTKDTVTLSVNSLMFYSIHSTKRAIYEVDDLASALSNTAQTQLKEVFGSMTFKEALESQKRINEHLISKFKKLFHGWGIEVIRMEMLDLAPQSRVRDEMRKQMVAERERRGDFIRSEGRKAAQRLKAEGARMVSINMGLAHQEATRKESEGESGARVELARAESMALDAIASAIRADGASQTQYLLSQRYVSFLKKLGRSAKSCNVFFPYSTTALSGMIDHLPDTFGRDADPQPLEPVTFADEDLDSDGGDDFDDLN